MKKFALFSTVALFVSLVSIGCSSNGGSTSSWCRSGSIWPISRSAEAQTVYMTGASASNCNPCEPAACAPCEPVCNPCEPACDPCVPRSGIYSRGIVPGPM